MNKCPSRFTLVSYMAGQQSTQQAVAVKTHLLSCEKCKSIVGEIENHQSQYNANLDKHHIALQEALKQEPVSISHRKKVVSIGIASALACAAAVLLIVIGFPSQQENHYQSQSQISYKGTLAVQVVAQRDHAQFNVEENSILKENDAIRFIISTPQEGYVSIFSFDKNHGIYPFYPETDPSIDKMPMKLNRAGKNELPGSIVMDDSVGIEYIVVLFSIKSFDRERLHQKTANMYVAQERPTSIEGVELKMIRIIKDND